MKKLILSFTAMLLFFSFFTQITLAQVCQTTVTVSVFPSTIYQGQSVTISGRVYSTRIDCIDPIVYLYLDGNYLAAVATDASGYYSYTYTTPYSISPCTHEIKAVSRIDCCAEDSATTSFSVLTAVQAPCSLSVSLTTPRDLFFGETIYSTVYLSNYGDVGGNVNFVAYVCRADDTNCQAMICDSFDPYYVYVPGHSTRTLSCSRTADELGLHKIKVVYSGCGIDPTIYSSVFNVKPYPACAAGYLNNFQCLGNWKQQLYQFADCRTEWRNVLYCEHGCSEGKCLEAPKHGIPEISTEGEYTVYRCERNRFTFEISNTGEASDTFDILFSGSAAKWVSSVSSVSLSPKERRTISAYATVPCSAEKGEYDLTISVVNGKKASTAAILTVSEGWAMLSKLVFYALLFLVVGAIFILLFLLVRKLPKRKERPESFSD
jgi:hypothetical protein